MRCFDMTEEIHCSAKIGTKPSILRSHQIKKRLIARQGLAVEVSVVYEVSVMSLLNSLIGSLSSGVTHLFLQRVEQLKKKNFLNKMVI